jgi:hypothetical protein
MPIVTIVRAVLTGVLSYLELQNGSQVLQITKMTIGDQTPLMRLIWRLCVVG